MNTLCINAMMLVATASQIFSSEPEMKVGNLPDRGIKVTFVGEKSSHLTTFKIDIEFENKDENYEYTNNIGQSPYSPQGMSKAFTEIFAEGQIETVKVDETSFVIVGYRAKDMKLYPVKSVKIVPKGKTPANMAPTIKEIGTKG